MAQDPQWFANQVLCRLSGVRRGSQPGQFYARCPVPAHGDRHASFAIRPGDKMTIVYHCQEGCAPEEIRDALAGLGVPDEHLGQYGTPEYEARRQVRATSEERRELERLRRELADLKTTVNGLLNTKMTQAMRHVRIQAVIEGGEVPDEKRAFIALAKRAGVSQSKCYETWDQVCMATGQPECVTEDHVVLTRPDGERQVVQRSAYVRFTSEGRKFPEREKSGSPRGKTDETDTAIEALRSAGLTPDKPAA